MKARIAYLWAEKRVLLLVFCGAVIFLGYFGVRTISSTVYWMDPAHQDQPLAGWMTPRYIQYSYNLRPDHLRPALFLAQDAPFKRRNLDQIAADNDVTLTELQSRIDAAVKAARAQGMRE